MPSLSVRIDQDNLRRLNRRLNQLLQNTLNLEPVMQEAAQYMVNSTRNRIDRSKTGPDGERWAALSELTIALKGHDQPLFHSGEMSRGIDVADASDDGFMVTSSAPHSSWMQRGIQKVTGKYKPKRPAPHVPARPFMGFSDENIRRISKLIRDHITRGGGQ